MAKYLTKSGTIEKSARNGKAFMIDEVWYSVYKVGQANGAEKGDSVSFEYETVVKGGQEFHNIKGDIKVDGRAAASAPSREEAPAREAPNGTKGVDGDAFRKRSMKYFPMPKDDVDRPIVRQNSLTNANAALAAFYNGEAGDQGMAPEDYAEQVIAIARLFEAYSTGEV